MTEPVQKPKLQETILEAYTHGAGDVEVAALLKVPLKKFQETCEQVPDFRRIVELGRTLSEAWWTSKGRLNLLTKEFNTALWNFNMKNRFNWRDKIDTAESNASEPMNLDQAKAELQRALRQIEKSHPEVMRQLNFEATDE